MTLTPTLTCQNWDFYLPKMGVDHVGHLRFWPSQLRCRRISWEFHHVSPCFTTQNDWYDWWLTSPWDLMESKNHSKARWIHDLAVGWWVAMWPNTGWPAVRVPRRLDFLYSCYPFHMYTDANVCIYIYVYTWLYIYIYILIRCVFIYICMYYVYVYVYILWLVSIAPCETSHGLRLVDETAEEDSEDRWQSGWPSRSFHWLHRLHRLKKSWKIPF